jgi:putative hydrolase of the HAD superfamily
MPGDKITMMDKPAYKHLFFDLDHTLWDFETNSLNVLKQIYKEMDLGQYNIPSFEVFHQTYLPINGQYWARYHNQLMTKEQLRVGRFMETLRQFKIEDIALAKTIARYYTDRSPYQTALLPDAIETLEYLAPRYEMHIITNGFQEIQEVKIKNSSLGAFFRHIFISEAIGHQKPTQEIFLHAMEAAGATVRDSLMIGDNMQTDILGARSVGMDQVFFNPRKTRHRDKATYEISELKELRNIL